MTEEKKVGDEMEGLDGLSGVEHPRAFYEAQEKAIPSIPKRPPCTGDATDQERFHYLVDRLVMLKRRRQAFDEIQAVEYLIVNKAREWSAERYDAELPELKNSQMEALIKLITTLDYQELDKVVAALWNIIGEP